MGPDDFQKRLLPLQAQVKLAIRNVDEMVKSCGQWFAVWHALVGKDEENTSHKKVETTCHVSHFV